MTTQEMWDKLQALKNPGSTHSRDLVMSEIIEVLDELVEREAQRERREIAARPKRGGRAA
jgi:hypothetical protein